MVVMGPSNREAKSFYHDLPTALVKARLLTAETKPEEEAAIIAQAGQKGAFTVATKMAGRGTDIRLQGGATRLFVILLAPNLTARSDRQAGNRAGRWTDAGARLFFGSWEDEIFQRFSSHADGPKLVGEQADQALQEARSQSEGLGRELRHRAIMLG